MRIISGSRRGMKLQSPPGEVTRPTGDRVKEGLFNILQGEIRDRRVLDAFAGSGALGLEALSRGAASAVFLEPEKRTLGALKKNLEKTGFPGATAKGLTLQAWAAEYRGQTFSLVFLDPPYHRGLAREALELMIRKNLLDAGALVVAETAADEEMPERTGDLCLRKKVRYGKTALWIYDYGNGEEQDGSHAVIGPD